jgi:hypothetical protein
MFEQACEQISELPKHGEVWFLFVSRYLCSLRNDLAIFRLSAIKGTLFLFLFNSFDDFSPFIALRFKYISI